MTPTKWDHRFMALAKLVASWSKDPSTQVGCVIADKHNRVISLGFNGAPRAVGDQFADRDQKIRRTIHAEKNAIAFAQRDITGSTVYVTHPPCAQCAAYLIQHGVGRVSYPQPTPDFLSRWGADQEEAEAMFAEAGIPCGQYEESHVD